MQQHPMIRRRSGTGGLYADNRSRREAAERWRGAHRSHLPRLPTAGRLWGPSGAAGGPQHFDLGALLVRSAEAVAALLDQLRDVGEEVTWCLRRRLRLTPQFLREMDEVLGWYVVLHTVGMLDRRGAWVGPSLLPARDLAPPPQSR